MSIRRAFSSAPDVLSSGRRPSTRSSGLEALAMQNLGCRNGCPIYDDDLPMRTWESNGNAFRRCRPTWVLVCLASGREFCKFEVPSEAPASFLCFMISCLFSVAPDRVKCMVVGKDSTGILIHSFSQISLKWLVRFEPEVYVNVVVMQALGLDLPLEVCRDHRCLSIPAGIHYSRRWEGPEWPLSGYGEVCARISPVGVTFARPPRDSRVTSAQSWGGPRVARRSRGDRAGVARTSRRLGEIPAQTSLDPLRVPSRPS